MSAAAVESLRRQELPWTKITFTLSHVSGYRMACWQVAFSYCRIMPAAAVGGLRRQDLLRAKSTFTPSHASRYRITCCVGTFYFRTPTCAECQCNKDLFC